MFHRPLSKAQFRHLARDEAGTGSILPMLVLTGLLAVAGFAMDTASLWRHGEVMRATADTAAHAGAVALARGNDPQDALAAAEQAIGLNMDSDIFSATLDKPRSDLVRLWHFDAETGELVDEGRPNAVSVQIRRSAEDGNSVPMYLLSLVGLGDVTASTTSVVALVPSSLCTNSAGLYARGALGFEGEVDVAENYCFHSQQEMTLERQVKLEDGARLSMPDMARCEGFCDDQLSPGLAKARTEVNLINRPLRDHIADLAAAMLGPLADSEAKSEFFATRPIARDLEPLAELGLDVTGLRTGSVVRMTSWDFEVLREVPKGLVYAVTCDPLSPDGPPVLEVGGGMSAAAVDDVVLLTNCALHFPDDIEVMGSLILSSYEGNLPSITADPYAVVGDPAVTCDPAGQTQVMALGDQVLPPGLLLSNVSMVLDGAVTILPEPNGALAQHHGFALHASGDVTVQGHHSFKGCESAGMSTLPSLDVIRFVMPKIPAQPRNWTPETDMPGIKVQPLPSTPPLPMSKVPPVDLLSQANIPDAEVGL